MQDTTANGNPIETTATPTPTPTIELLQAQIEGLNNELNRRRESELHLIKWRDDALPKMAEKDKIISSLKAESDAHHAAWREAAKQAFVSAALHSKLNAQLKEMKARLSAIANALAGV